MSNTTFAELYDGVGIIFDDELKDKNTDLDVSKIITQLDERGIPMVVRYEIPEDPVAVAKHLRNISFIILDWEFINIEDQVKQEGVTLGDTLKNSNKDNIVDLINEFLKNTFCPIFIFSKDDPNDINRVLIDEKVMTQKGHPRILVRRKSDLLNGKLFSEIEEWLKSHLSVYVLKKWKTEHVKSQISLFKIFEEIHHSWPKALWDTFKADGISPSEEISALLFRNMQACLSPFTFDASLFDSATTESLSQNDVRKVLSGERMIPNSVLNKEFVAPGDIFLDCKNLYINIRPACDCIPRNAGDDIILYLLQGKKMTSPGEAKNYDDTHGHLMEIDCQAIVFALHNGKSYDFRFKDLEQRSWNEWKAKRIGRLLPPYITRLQQRYAAYLQREGLPRIPNHAINRGSE